MNIRPQTNIANPILIPTTEISRTYTKDNLSSGILFIAIFLQMINIIDIALIMGSMHA